MIRRTLPIIHADHSPRDDIGPLPTQFRAVAQQPFEANSISCEQDEPDEPLSLAGDDIDEPLSLAGDDIDEHHLEGEDDKGPERD